MTLLVIGAENNDVIDHTSDDRTDMFIVDGIIFNYSG